MSKPAKRTDKTDPYAYVFVFTYGRSGSTLLMGFLNSLPGFCIRGENHNALVHLCNFYRSAKQSKTQVGKKSMKTTHPWYGVDNINVEDIRSEVRKLFVRTILVPDAGIRVVGCKEIRINLNEISDIDEFLTDLLEIFDNAKIIFNHRDILVTSRSSWWKETSHAFSTIRSMDRRLRNNALSQKENVFHVEYEKLIKDDQHARELTAFLGVPFDAKAYRKVMATRHSY